MPHATLVLSIQQTFANVQRKVHLNFVGCSSNPQVRKGDWKEGKDNGEEGGKVI